ncbi:EF-hand calcium-binding domain-containing protein 10 [Astatotilapia calliptera]|uniref:EF-hand domain-containing protein n=1 Tax=Astatotilapia calliptera TaxID=8154 RepID=A0A3P8QYD9_ASTCA|nr:EF-hand calcium-binding domain-containing protein 10 [Astatotilapia calliptera]
MAARREEDAAVYLEKHKLIELMDNLTSMLFFYRPEKPREFLIEKLEQLKLSQQSGVIGPNLFDDSNLDVVFRIMDPDNKQYISFVQYKQALTMMGIKDINECPDGVNEDRISHETFKIEATQGLERCSATYVQL